MPGGVRCLPSAMLGRQQSLKPACTPRQLAPPSCQHASCTPGLEHSAKKAASARQPPLAKALHQRPALDQLGCQAGTLGRHDAAYV